MSFFKTAPGIAVIVIGSCAVCGGVIAVIYFLATPSKKTKVVDNHDKDDTLSTNTNNDTLSLPNNTSSEEKNKKKNNKNVKTHIHAKKKTKDDSHTPGSRIKLSDIIGSSRNSDNNKNDIKAYDIDDIQKHSTSSPSKTNLVPDSVAMPDKLPELDTIANSNENGNRLQSYNDLICTKTDDGYNDNDDNKSMFANDDDFNNNDDESEKNEPLSNININGAGSSVQNINQPNVTNNQPLPAGNNNPQQPQAQQPFKQQLKQVLEEYINANPTKGWLSLSGIYKPIAKNGAYAKDNVTEDDSCEDHILYATRRMIETVAQQKNDNGLMDLGRCQSFTEKIMRMAKKNRIFLKKKDKEMRDLKDKMRSIMHNGIHEYCKKIDNVASREAAEFAQISRLIDNYNGEFSSHKNKIYDNQEFFVNKIAPLKNKRVDDLDGGRELFNLIRTNDKSDEFYQKISNFIKKKCTCKNKALLTNFMVHKGIFKTLTCDVVSDAKGYIDGIKNMLSDTPNISEAEENKQEGLKVLEKFYKNKFDLEPTHFIEFSDLSKTTDNIAKVLSNSSELLKLKGNAIPYMLGTIIKEVYSKASNKTKAKDFCKKYAKGIARYYQRVLQINKDNSTIHILEYTRAIASLAQGIGPDLWRQISVGNDKLLNILNDQQLIDKFFEKQELSNEEINEGIRDMSYAALLFRYCNDYKTSNIIVNNIINRLAIEATKKTINNKTIDKNLITIRKKKKNSRV